MVVQEKVREIVRPTPKAESEVGQPPPGAGGAGAQVPGAEEQLKSYQVVAGRRSEAGPPGGRSRR